MPPSCASISRIRQLARCVKVAILLLSPARAPDVCARVLEYGRAQEREVGAKRYDLLGI
jgi:hypothetical protein